MVKRSKYILNNVDILIVLKVDSQERLFNVELIINFLLESFETNIYLLEAGDTPWLNPPLKKEINYEFVKYEDPFFHITKFRNYLLSKSKSDIIIQYDADVLVDPVNIWSIVNKIKLNLFDVGYPYDGRFCNVSPMFKRVYQQARRFDFLETYSACFELLFTNSVGGIFICSRSFFKKIGFENECIVSWGPDDKDRFYKCLKADARIIRTENILYHLDHPQVSRSKESIKISRNYIKNLY